MSSLQRLLRPQTIAMVGGKEVSRSIVQCDRIGFEGEIWPVNPKRSQIEGRNCYPTLQDLPGVPDAAFIAIPGEATVEAVEYLASVGTGGVVCYASGFAEIGETGAKLQKRLEDAIGAMALIGPNCYGVLNYLDGVALWPDEQGGRRCDRGVAIISQSGNISINLTMQRRAVPLAYVISTGNMAGLKTHDYIYAMLTDDRVTAIGLYLEGIPDAVALSEVAIAALEVRKPIVVLESGRSEIGSKVTLSHSSSLTGQGQVNNTFYKKFGILQVHTIPEFLETLKFMSTVQPLRDLSIATISCSGGEAAIMADHAESMGLEFTPFNSKQTEKLNAVLGDRVVIDNPLDYHTYIWGMPDQQQECFQAVFEGDQAITINAIDYPSEGLCDTSEWDDAIQAIINAKKNTQAQVTVMASLHENLPEKVQLWLSDNGIAPMLGLEECFKAIILSAAFNERCSKIAGIQPLSPVTRIAGKVITLSEFEGKGRLRKVDLPVVTGALARGYEEALDIVETIGFPIVLKAVNPNIVHKTEAGAIHLNINSSGELKIAMDSMLGISDQFLIEKMASKPLLELLVGVRYDERFGFIMVIGAGGTLVEVIEDVSTLMFPISQADVIEALNQLKIGRLFKQFRGKTADLDAVIEVIVAIASYVAEFQDNLFELEVNPLFVYEKGDGVLAIDVIYRKLSRG